MCTEKLITAKRYFKMAAKCGFPFFFNHPVKLKGLYGEMHYEGYDIILSVLLKTAHIAPNSILTLGTHTLHTPTHYVFVYNNLIHDS